jgi:D-galactose 1-dehydrogenase
MIGVGIVGLGHVAAHHVEALGYCPELELVAGCDPQSAALERLPKDTRHYSRLEEMLDADDIDVVVVASPNSLHVEHSRQVIASGKWLMLEKPVAVSREDAAAVARARRELSGRCTVALHAAFGLEVLWLCQKFDCGAFDRQSVARVVSGFYDPYFVGGRLLGSARSLSGSWLDSGINALSVLDRLLAGATMSITDSRMTRIAGTDCTEIQGSVDYRFSRQSGIGTGLIDTNWTIGRDSKATTLHLQDGRTTIVADHSAQSVFLHENGSVSTLFQCDNGRDRLTNHYVGVFTDLIRQIECDRDNFDMSMVLHDLVYAGEE